MNTKKDGRRVNRPDVMVDKTLAAEHQELLKEWDYESNTREGLDPTEISSRTKRKAHWRCSTCGHCWIAGIRNRAVDGRGCHKCTRQIVTSDTCLAETHKELMKEWDHEANARDAIDPTKVSAGSKKKAHWCCSTCDHRWQAPISNRTRNSTARKASGCPACAGLVASAKYNLATECQELLKLWDCEKNDAEGVKPTDLTPRSGQKVHWKCDKGHTWVKSPRDMVVCKTSRGRGCRQCYSVEGQRPELLRLWDYDKNAAEGIYPDRVTPQDGRQVHWKCENGHTWTAPVYSLRAGSRCKFCAGQVPTPEYNLATEFPKVAAEWDEETNAPLTARDVLPGSEHLYHWRCERGHHWQASVVSRTGYWGKCKPANCPACESIEYQRPDLLSSWDYEKNDALGIKPTDVTPGSTKLVHWKCKNDHSWMAPPYSRVVGTGCAFCAGKAATPTTSLRGVHPELALEWHTSKNEPLTPDEVMPGSGKKVWWRCRLDPSHEWQAIIQNRTRGDGCPYCNGRWTLEAIRFFVASLKEHLETFTPAELYLLFQQNGLLTSSGKGKTFVKALSTGRFPKEEVAKFLNGEPSLVDQFVQDPTQTLETLETNEAKPVGAEGAALDQADAVIERVEEEREPHLPVVETKDVLASLGLPVISSADEEAVEFLIASGIAKIWKHAYRDETAAVAQAEAFCGEGYAKEIRKRFLDEYRQVRDLAIPEGYAFRINGEPTLPNLMQRHFAVRVQQRKRVGNWSGTGAGKTLAAVLATRVVGSKRTVICCPNSVVEGWRRVIQEIFPDSIVAAKTFAPDWSVAADHSVHRYLILNYEAFQQPDSAERVRSLVADEPIDFVIVDEIHYAKQRSEDISQRRQLVAALTTLAAERNPDLHVLGMSATPVINNLQEGKSMVELVTGLAHDELDTRPTVPNCMALHQRLVTLGIRWMPEYQLRYEQREIEVDCSPFLDEIRALGGKGTPLALEQILTRARLPVIRAHVEPKTLIYTHYVQGIDRLLRDALVEDGWKVGFYTGEDKSGLDGFLKGDVDVLIGSSSIGTGVDGLQQVCNRLIVNVLPWTAAEFEQLKGRIYRQGQRRENVTMILPLTCAEVHGERWSWCQSKMQRLRFKKSIADAAVDGVVPEGHLRTPAQAYQDVMAWLERLDTGKVEVITRPRIVVPLPDADPADMKRRRRRYGDFSTMNRTWNQGRSEATHARLQANPEEWAQYHTLYREARKDWVVVPYEEMIRWCQQRSGYVIGDFGCGEAKLAEAVSDRHTVHNFDHVAINENVVACDMAHVPLDDDTLDVAIFSLSLMGANFADYLREGYRTLKLDGQLHILEATERFTDRNAFVKGLEALGFAIVSVEDKWKFTHLRAIKTERRRREDMELRF